MASDKRKQSLYFPEDMLLEIQAEADRQDRSLSWIVQKAWELAREKMGLMPDAPKTELDEVQGSRAGATFAQGKFDRSP